jgi:ethanolamine utilization microcompartment shell protein EutL
MKILLTLLLALSLFPASTFASTSKASTPNVPINLGTSANFGLLAGSGITNVSSATMITGDVGSAPTPAVTGLLASQVNGTLYLNPDPATTQAQVDLTVAYNQAAGAPCGTDLTGQDLGGLTLVPGVYCFSSSALLTGTLTLDAQGNENSQWIFQMGSTLTTAVNSTVTIINGGTLCNVYWQIGSSATIQTGNVFLGNILALTSITLDGGTLEGRALAMNGAVTMASQETVDNSDCSCTIFTTSSSRGAVSKLTAPAPKQSVIAKGLTSSEGIACGANQLLYVAQSGVSGGPLRIVTINQSGKGLKDYLDFAKTPALASSGGPIGPTIQPGTGLLFFSTTDSNGFANTGVWSAGKGAPVQVMLPFASNGTTDGGGATAFLINGPYSGNLLAVDVANKKIVRVAAPFTAPQAGTDFITTNLTSPTGLAVNGLGHIFVSNADGTIEQFGSDGTFLGQYATTGLQNINIAARGIQVFVTTSTGRVIWIHSDGTQSTVGNVVSADGVAVCPYL